MDWPDLLALVAAEDRQERQEGLESVLAAGLRVMPLYNAVPTPEGGWRCSCGCTGRDAGKHPRFKGWETLATTDSAQVKDWWRRWPEANIGVTCGATSGRINLVVVDLDGPEAASSVAKAELSFPLTYEVITGRPEGDGRHFYYWTDEVLDSRKGDLPGLGVVKVDVRGQGGYVVGAGSRHRTGKLYRADGFAPERLVALPPDMLVALRPSPQSSARTSARTRSQISSGVNGDPLHRRLVLPSDLSDRMQNNPERGRRSEPAFGALLALTRLTDDDDVVVNEMRLAPIGERYRDGSADLFAEVGRARAAADRDEARRQQERQRLARVAALARQHLAHAPATLRVLLGVISLGTQRGFDNFAASQPDIAIACARATSSVRTQLLKLERDGWLSVDKRAGGSLATRYRVTVPEVLRGHLPHPTHSACTGVGDVHLTDPQAVPLDLSADAARWRASHNLWFVVENLSEERAVTVKELAVTLKRTERSITRYRSKLRDLGLIEDGPDLRLVPNWLAVWDALAVSRGTKGRKQEAIEQQEADRRVRKQERLRLAEAKQLLLTRQQLVDSGEAQPMDSGEVLVLETGEIL